MLDLPRLLSPLRCNADGSPRQPLAGLFSRGSAARPVRARAFEAIACLGVLCVAIAGTALAGAFSRSAHGDRGELPGECRSCHVAHGRPGTLMMSTQTDSMCLQCHGDSGARTAMRGKGLLNKTEGLGNIAAELRKSSRHPVGETRLSGRFNRFPKRIGDAGATSSELSCVDCHDPHYEAKRSEKTQENRTQVKMRPDARGKEQAEYKICYQCHGTSGEAGRSSTNIEELMRSGNASYHPVEAVGRNKNVPSLIRPYSRQSILACTDCHGSDGNDAPAGPHGSAFAPILKENYQTEDGRAESSYEYALCYRCHSRSVILGRGAFPEHRRHLVDAKASCRACHNSHGSSKYSHLIDFDKRIVTANTQGRLQYVEKGSGSGSCSLLCHGRDHDEESY